MPKDRKPRLIIEEREEEPEVESEESWDVDIPGEATPEEPPVEEHQGSSYR